MVNATMTNDDNDGSNVATATLTTVVTSLAIVNVFCSLQSPYSFSSTSEREKVDDLPIVNCFGLRENFTE